MKLLICLVGLLLLSGCAEPITHEMTVDTVKHDHRIKVERIDVIEDWLAYNQRRGIYIITDTKTGKEYIGVSGVGITETAVHSHGKTSSVDEQ